MVGTAQLSALSPPIGSNRTIRIRWNKQRSPMKLNIATLAIILVAAVLLGMRAMQLPWTPPRIAGAAIAAPSLLLLVLARLQLGRAFSVQAKASTLVTTGLYSRIRNPIYVFGCLMITGIIIWAQKPWFLLVFVILIPMQVIRSRKEARVLEEKFGTAYQDYKQKSWF
jgi:protein-S-isoprenylcysteine O-methyltransferase Ste14